LSDWRGGSRTQGEDGIGVDAANDAIPK
jgi:hypothetical protein